MTNVYYVKHQGVSPTDAKDSLFSLIVPENFRNNAARDYQRAIKGNYFDPNRGIFLKAVTGLSEENYARLNSNDKLLDEAILNQFEDYPEVEEIITILQYGLTENSVDDVYNASKDTTPF